jgi:hypothetical protein
MATKVLEVVVCDLCKVDRPATNHREIDVCGKHDQQLEDRIAASGYSCVCGRSFPTGRSLNSHINRSTKGTHGVAE